MIHRADARCVPSRVTTLRRSEPSKASLHASSLLMHTSVALQTTRLCVCRVAVTPKPLSVCRWLTWLQGSLGFERCSLAAAAARVHWNKASSAGKDEGTFQVLVEGDQVQRQLGRGPQCAQVTVVLKCFAPSQL